MEGSEAAFLEFVFDLLNPEAVSERRVHVEGLGSYSAPFLFGQRIDRPHVVGSIGQLDEQDPDVLRHGDCHLADRRCLLLFAARELDPIQLRDSIDEERHLVAEVALEILEADVRIFDNVVQERGNDRGRVKPVRGEDLGHRDRVGDVRITGPTLLAGVGLGGDGVGTTDHVNIGSRMMLRRRPR